MAVMKMVAVTMIGPQQEMEPVARQIVLTGGFQPLPLDMLVNDRALRAQVTTETGNPYDELLSKVSAVWKVAGESIPEPSPVTLSKDFTLSVARMQVDQAAKRLEVWAKRRVVMLDEEEELQAAELLFTALQDTRFNVDDLAEGTYLVAFFGRLSDENYQRLLDSSEDSSLLINRLSSINGNSWILALTEKDNAVSVKKLLDAVSFREFLLKDISGQFAGDDKLSLVKKRIANYDRAISGLAKAARLMLHTHRADYELLYSRLYTMQRVYDICRGRGEISGMYVLSGWIPEDTFADIKKTVAEKAPMTTIMVEKTKDIKELRVPTLLTNNKLFRAFQDIVAMYSLPAYGEIDPSPVVAISFVFFFGFMFGDIGHGLVLFLGCLLAVRQKWMKPSLGFVMRCAGISSMIFGVLYGSVFGMEGIIPALWMSPMQNINRLIVVAICVGVFTISFGLILNMIKQYMARDFGRMLFDGQGLAGLALYWTMAALAAIYMTGTKVPDKLAEGMWIGVFVLMLLMIFRDVLARYLLREKEENESMVMNMFEILHSLMSFLSNTTSFVRLAAFALNHVGLSIAVIMLSDMVHKLPGGIIMKGTVLVLGNIVIVCLEGLIVFIQTLRLEYYEFFGKFYKGGGSTFRPVGWKKDGSQYTAASSK